MSTAANLPPPVVPATSESRYLWFFDTLVCVRIGIDGAREGTSVLEHHAAFGDSPPLHIHRTEDEIFYVLQGELRFRVGEGELRVGPNSAITAPKGVAHTYRVESPEGARWLTVTTRGDFERFVRTLGRPAGHMGLPSRGAPPSPEQMAEVGRLAAAHGIDLVGPPLGATAN